MYNIKYIQVLFYLSPFIKVSLLLLKYDQMDTLPTTGSR